MIEFAVYVRVDRTGSRFASSGERGNCIGKDMERIRRSRVYYRSKVSAGCWCCDDMDCFYLYYRAGLSHACPTDLKY